MGTFFFLIAAWTSTRDCVVVGPIIYSRSLHAEQMLKEKLLGFVCPIFYKVRRVDLKLGIDLEGVSIYIVYPH